MEVILEDGRRLHAKKTIIATGAWPSRLVNLTGVMEANAVAIGHIQLTDAEYAGYRLSY